MALAIDTRYLLERWIPDQEHYLDTFSGSKGRFQLHRVSAYATISSSSHDDDATTLVATVQSPAFLARTMPDQNWAYQRYSVKMIMDDHADHGPRIVWASATDRCDLSVVWHIQLDFVDLLSSIGGSTLKRRRSCLFEDDGVEVKKRITACSDAGAAGDVASHG